MTIKDQIAALYVDYVGVELAKVHAATDLAADLKMDSLDVLFMAQNLEADFKISVEDDEMAACKTLQDVVDMVERKQTGLNPHGSGPVPVGPREGVQ